MDGYTTGKTYDDIYTLLGPIGFIAFFGTLFGLLFPENTRLFGFINSDCLNCGKHVSLGIELQGMSGLVCKECYSTLPILTQTKYLGGHPDLYSLTEGYLVLFKDRLAYSYGKLGGNRLDIPINQIQRLTPQMGNPDTILNFTIADSQDVKRNVLFSHRNPTDFIKKSRNIIKVE